MTLRRLITSAAATCCTAAFAQSHHAPLDRHPDAIVNLKTVAAGAVGAQWRVAEAQLTSSTNPAPGPDGRPTGAARPAFDLSPKAQAPDFDDSGWRTLAPDQLESRIGPGKVSFAWYRLHLTLPEMIDGVEVEGATIALNLRVDDYAEVWVDGVLPYRFAQEGGAVVAGWNAPNRVTLTSSAAPGQHFTVAIFAMNGPVSEAPSNYIWIREASLELYSQPRAVAPEAVGAEIVRLDPGLDAVLSPGAVVERIARGFKFTEGPVWDRATSSLLFSDPNANTIYRWRPAGALETVMQPSGYAGADVREYRQPGSNGLTFDHGGRLTINQHGNRRVIRIEGDGSETVLADRHQGMRLNSPNDLVYRSDGSLYFTDPPFGLPAVYDDPRKDTPYSGVYRLHHGKLELLNADLKGPNGLAFSNKETHLYVGDWDEQHKAVMRYPLLADGRLGDGEVFADFTGDRGEEAIDGVKVDWQGNVYICGPGGLWIVAPDGTRLGMLRNVETPHNIAFGEDGRTLFMTCHTGVYRVRLGVAGPMP